MALMDAVRLLGGLGFFLFGMRTMSEGLEKAAGVRLKPILQAVTRGRFSGMLTGAAVTAAIQSSSATTVMTIGFVQAGMMTLRQAASIIMGANIGTTATALMLSAKIDFSAVFAAGGLLLMFMPARRPGWRSLGNVMIGLAVLFTGMDVMSGAVRPLRELPAFREAMASVGHPLAGIAVGTAVTAVLQSSSAGIGILQALAGEGLITLSGAQYIIFGQNIGTCVTAMLACMGASYGAKRAAVIHLFFNIIGTVLMTAISLLFPLGEWIGMLTPDSVRLQIALMHLTFNLVTTAVLLPASDMLVWLSCKIIRGE